MGRASDVARAYFDVLQTHDPENCRELIGEDYTYTDGSGATQQGADAAVAVMRMYLEAFPDLSVDMHHVHEDGDTAVCEFTAHGTHTGHLGEIAPTNKKVEVFVCNVIEVRDGKIVAEREYFDQMSFMAQLGLVPEHAAA